jgi:hypothetical protein
MRFRRWPKPTAFEITSRKRAAFLRKQRLEREALPLLADHVAAGQHDVEVEMALRAVRWDRDQQNSRDQRAARWRDQRARLFALPDAQRRQVRNLWRTCPYPPDPSYFGDLLREIAIGKLDPNRPPWAFH